MGRSLGDGLCSETLIVAPLVVGGYYSSLIDPSNWDSSETGTFLVQCVLAYISNEAALSCRACFF